MKNLDFFIATASVVILYAAFMISTYKEFSKTVDDAVKKAANDK
jgi:hypothetical protein